MTLFSARGGSPDQAWTRELPGDRTVEVGRSAGDWSASWDGKISRVHFRLRLHRGLLEVEQIPETLNPIFHRGRRRRRFDLKPGESFVVGETVFTFEDGKAAPTMHMPAPHRELTVGAHELRRMNLKPVERRIEALSRLPETISRCVSDVELCKRLTQFLIASFPLADEVSVLEAPPSMTEDRNPDADPSEPIRELASMKRISDGSERGASPRLIRQALRTGEPALHRWRGESAKNDGEGTWALAAPFDREAFPGRLAYLRGREPREADDFGMEDAAQDMKLAELAVRQIESASLILRLQKRDSEFRRFFSPVVVEALKQEDPEQALAPREATLTVLFCDLRGFTRRTDEHADELLSFLEDVSDALGLVTSAILDQEGVVGDFHGDAVMGFWGWPIARPDDALRACRAALSVAAAFQERGAASDAPLGAGIGIATGKGVAGRIGTSDQAKVTVFGPPANRAARLEHLNKPLSATILLDQATAEALPKEESTFDVRKVAMVRPPGVLRPVWTYELRAPSQRADLTVDDLRAYERGVEAFTAGNWEAALSELQRVPATDRVKDVVVRFILERRRTPPPGWDGVLPVE